MKRSATPPWRLNCSVPEAAAEQSLEAAVAGSIQSLQGTLIDCQAHLVEQVNMQLRARMLRIPPPPSTPCPSLLPIPPPPPLPKPPHGNDSSKGGHVKGGWRPKAAWEWRDHDKAIGKPAAERRNHKCKTVEGRERFQAEQQLRHNNRFQARLAAVVTSSSSSDAPCALPAEASTELPTVKEDDNDIDSGDHVTVDPYMEVEAPPISLNKRACLIAAVSKAIKNEHDAT